MQKSKKVRMPAGIRNKLMAAVAMLLVSSIMMVSSTYAWFTLSTAPEVTGITTSVGANGNLEIALLNGQTYDDMTRIASAVGDSSAVKDVAEANITWGNLVDLSDTSYGLNLIALNPAALNSTKAEDGTITVGETLLKTAEYGPDGRVSELKDNTISGVYNGTNAKWVTTQDFGTEAEPNLLPAYGVRAIGVDSNMTTAQIVYNAAVSAVNSGNRSASSPVSSAVAANKTEFLSLAMSLNGSSSETVEYSVKELAALKAVAEGVESSLNTIVKTYANAILATLATEDLTDEQLTYVRGELSSETNASELSAFLTSAEALTGVDVSAYTGSLASIATQQGKVAVILGLFTVDEDGTVGTVATTTGTDEDGNSTTVAVDVTTHIVKPLIGTSVVAYDAEGTVTTISGTDFNAVANVDSMYLSDGLVADVATETGTYEMCTAVALTAEITVYAGARGADTGNLDTAAAEVATLESPSGENAEQTIADFYGYVLDFAFRTNAAGSSLQLQTEAANRVYSNAEGDNLATQGAGSTATFAFDASVLNEEQVRTLLGAIRLVFLNPVDGTVHKHGGLTNIKIDGSEATASVILENQTGDAAPIVDLAQNVPTAVSVLVYLDGNEVDNGDVANAASSGMLNLNLQFSSSAELVPMQNTTLQTMTAYTVTFNANGGTGFMQPVKVYGDSYTLPTTATFTRTGYTFDGWVTEANGSAITELTEMKEDATVYAVWTAATYNVTASSGVSGGSTATAGQDYTFTFDSSSYNLGEVTVGGTRVNPTKNDAGSYTIPGASVTGDIVINVTEIEEKEVSDPTSYKVTLPEGVNGEAEATAGEPYSFTIADGYTFTQVTATVGGNSVNLTESDGTYTISAIDVKGDIEVKTVS